MLWGKVGKSCVYDLFNSHIIKSWALVKLPSNQFWRHICKTLSFGLNQWSPGFWLVIFWEKPDLVLTTDILKGTTEPQEEKPPTPSQRNVLQQIGKRLLMRFSSVILLSQMGNLICSQGHKTKKKVQKWFLYIEYTHKKTTKQSLIYYITCADEAALLHREKEFTLLFKRRWQTNPY